MLARINASVALTKTRGKMVSSFKNPCKISAYRDRRFPGIQEEYEQKLRTSTTVYVGNLFFYTMEEKVFELFSRGGEIKKIIIGLDKNTKTPSGFCFVLYYSREDAVDSVKHISGIILDDRPIHVDFDWVFEEDRQGAVAELADKSFPVRHEYRTSYDPGEGPSFSRERGDSDDDEDDDMKQQR